MANLNDSPIESSEQNHMSVDGDDCFSISSTFDKCENETKFQTESVSDDETHSLASYRIKQRNINLPSVRKITYPTLSQSMISSSDLIDNQDIEQQVHEKINRLSNDVSIQQHHIIQASHALNTCAASFEFSGSTESVVAEWKLLVTTHSRDATLQELNRLRQEQFIRAPNASKDCGRLVISDINIPLRQDYITKLATDTIWGHHLVCLLKMASSEHVVATKAIPTLPGLLTVKFPDSLKLENVFSDFKVTLEIYGMLAQPDILPHDIKYHIKTKKIAGIAIGFRTPKNKKTKEVSRAQLSTVKSTPDENEVRKPNFKHIGSVNVSLSEIRRTNWPIHLNVDDSPLNGVLSMKINCELAVNVEYKAFLTIFEDVSGLGVWNRRWCYLNGYILSYWRYPDDEQLKPLGIIDLKLCQQHRISEAPPDICARLNTLLILLRTQETVRRYLMSCDTKDECIQWCEHLNKALQRAIA